MKKSDHVWHPNSQMREWESFDKIVKGDGMWLIDSNGNKILDGVSSMWCNVWGHSKKELTDAIIQQAKAIPHVSMFNLTSEPAEKLANELVQIAKGMERVFFSDNGSSAMEIAIKVSLQYWKNKGNSKKNKIATLENGYHGDTFGAMSVGYVPEFFDRFKDKLFSTQRFPVPRPYRIPKGFTENDYIESCLEKIEKKLTQDDRIASFVMESGAQVAGGVNIYPESFQEKISKICKKNEVLLVLDEIATGFGRLGSMTEYTTQNSAPDIVSFGKMLTGGYLTLAATLTTKKVYDSFLGDFNEWKHLFHGHTYTGNSMACAVANQNIKMYKKYHLIKEVRKKSKIFSKRKPEFEDLEIVGHVRTKGMLMGIELVSDKTSKKPILPLKSINKIFFEEGKRNGVYLRTLGNIVMLVPPLAISEKEIDLLINRTLLTIKSVYLKYKL